VTLAELETGVALLGFENSLASLDDTAEQHFWHAVNRALWTVNRLRPKKEVYPLCHFSPQNLLTYENRKHTGGVSLDFTAFGAKSYTFSVSGTGECLIKNGENTLSLTWRDTQNKRFCGFLSGGEVTLSFGGEYDYPITSLALWDGRVSDNTADIPEGTDTVIYNLTRICPDFLRLDEMPFPEGAPDGVKILGPAHIGVKRENEGCIAVCYRKRWEPITENTEKESLLPLDEDLCQLLAPLVASELCLDADEEKAAYYRGLYAEQAREVATELLPHTPSVFVSHNNW